MNGYFYVLTAIDLFVLSFMCILTKFSESLNKKQKRGFFLAFTLIAGISVLEVVTLAVDGAPAGYRWLNILSNYLGFGLSPAVSLCMVYVMDRKKMVNFWFRAAVCCEGGYLLFLALSIPAGLVFSVSEDNVYSRGPYFCIYILMYLAAIVYLSASTIVTAREFQNRSRALILGTWPSPKSREMAFYYGHPQNRFWPMMAALTGEPVPAREDIEAKKQIILRHGLALWDTLERCTITGAADASIKDAVPNDIAALLAKAPIEAVFCNGATAYRIYTKYLQPVSGIAAVKLPSTSPANAACRPEKLREIWGAALLPWINK